MTAHTQPSERLEGAAYRTRTGEQVILRHCRGLAEFEACVLLQRQTWGTHDLEVTPRKSFMLAQELGGQVIGAFDQSGRMVGMVMAMAALESSTAPAYDLPKPYLHSHMLAVVPEYRNQGLGARLKLVQREDALARGIERMTWTFDPLAAKNAYLNLHRLGAIARRYSPDFYGVSSSRLQAGLPTDRLHADWWLASARVRACVDAIAGSKVLAEARELSEDDAIESSAQAISLPVEVETWKQESTGVEKVRAVQSTNRALFLDAFAQGLAVTDFCTNVRGDGMYKLAAWHPKDARP
jgi:predicted GNAT superfamily acetyltransferase